MGRRRTPQEKKVLSYQRDRRNSYRENSKASRKNIPRSKARAERSYRSHVNQVLKAGDVEDVDLFASAIRRRDFDKTPDVPLVDHLDGAYRNPGISRSPRVGLRELARRRLRSRP